MQKEFFDDAFDLPSAADQALAVPLGQFLREKNLWVGTLGGVRPDLNFVHPTCGEIRIAEPPQPKRHFFDLISRMPHDVHGCTKCADGMIIYAHKPFFLRGLYDTPPEDTWLFIVFKLNKMGTMGELAQELADKFGKKISMIYYEQFPGLQQIPHIFMPQPATSS